MSKPKTKDANSGIEQALKDIAAGLVRLNEGRDEFYREVIATLRALREEGDPKSPGVDQASGSDDAGVRR